MKRISFKIFFFSKLYIYSRVSTIAVNILETPRPLLFQSAQQSFLSGFDVSKNDDSAQFFFNLKYRKKLHGTRSGEWINKI